MNQVDDDKIKMQNSNKNFYEVTFENKGGLVTPLIIEWTYEDGSIEIETIPLRDSSMAMLDNVSLDL